VVVATVRKGTPVAFVPPGAVAFRERAGQLPSPIAGPSEVALSAGDTVSFPIGKFVVTVAAEPLSSAPWGLVSPLKSSLTPLRHVAVAAAAHALLIGLSAHAAHAGSLVAAEDDHADLRRYLAASEDRTQAFEKIVTDNGDFDLGRDVNAEEGNGQDGGGTRAKGKEGSMGATVSRQKGQSRFAVTGRDENSRTVASGRAEALAEASEFGIIALLGADKSDAPLTPWGNAAAGADPIAASGAMWGTWIGEYWGAGGLGLTGIGEGGGGRGEGIGLGTIGTIGHTHGRPGKGTGGAGTLTLGGISGIGEGGWWGGDGVSLGTIGTIGHGAGTGEGERGTAYDIDPRHKRLEKPGASDDGEPRLPADVIRRIVRQSSGTFRGCYQKALLAKPDLRGNVTTSFLIGKDGRVKTAQNVSASLPDKAVVACVTRAFAGLTFPEPPGGRPVTVTYPLTFSPTKR
jgi:hypothetical protein